MKLVRCRFFKVAYNTQTIPIALNPQKQCKTILNQLNK